MTASAVFMIAGVILSGGASERMGTPKATIKIGNTSFINSILARLYSGGTSVIYIITGEHHQEIVRSLDPKSICKVVRNFHPENGQLSSLQLAVRNFDQQVTGMLVVLVDHPLVREDTYRELLKTAAADPDSIIIPCYRQERGHPVYIGRKFFQELLDAPLVSGARTVIRNNAQYVRQLPVDDPGVLQDLDTPGDLVKYAVRPVDPQALGTGQGKSRQG